MDGHTAHHPTWTSLEVEGLRKPAYHVLHQQLAHHLIKLV